MDFIVTGFDEKFEVFFLVLCTSMQDDDNAISCTSGSVDNVIFAHNGLIGRMLKLTQRGQKVK